MTKEKKDENIKMLIIGLLVLNVLLGVYIGFFKHDALWLETLKAWWPANMTMAEQLYRSPVYIQQQKTTLDQILGSMNQPAVQPTAQPTAQPTTTTQQPTTTTTAQPTTQPLVK